MDDTSDSDALEGRIVEPHEWPPLDEHGWPLWLPGTPA